MAVYAFSEAFQRKILAVWIRSAGAAWAHGVVRAAYFGSGAPGPPSTPRHVLAELVANYYATFTGAALSAETMDQLVADALLRLRPQVRGAVEAEWRIVRAIDTEDAPYVARRVTAWAQETAFAHAIAAAASTLAEAEARGVPPDLATLAEPVMAATRLGTAQQERAHSWRGVSDIWETEMDPARRIPTLLPAFDAALGGGCGRGELMVLLAPPKAAKTCLLVNLTIAASQRHYGVAFFSYEMRWQAMLMRLDQRLAGQSRGEIYSDTTHLRRMHQGRDVAGLGPVWVEEFVSRKHGCEEALHRVEALRAAGMRVDVVVLDYLTLMTSRGHEREKRHELAAIAREMSALAKELDAAVWSAALTQRKSVDRPRVAKQDVAECYEIMAVVDGAVAITSSIKMREQGERNLWVTSLRMEADERSAGMYKVNLAKQLWTPNTDPSMEARGGPLPKEPEQ